MKVGAVPVRRTVPLAAVLIAMMLLAAPAAQANFTWSSGIPFSGEVENAPACLGANSLTISWGDGNASSQGSFDFNGAVTGDHTYAAQGTFAGSVTFGDGPCAGPPGWLHGDRRRCTEVHPVPSRSPGLRLRIAGQRRRCRRRDPAGPDPGAV